MQVEPTDPQPFDDDPEDLAVRLRRQAARVKRLVEWELWLREPRSFTAPEESPSED